MSAVGDLTWELCDLNQAILATITTHDEGAQVTLGRMVARTATLTLDLDDDVAQLASVGDQVLRCSADGWTDPLFIGRVMQHDITYDGNSADLKISAADPLAHLEACQVFNATAGMSPSALAFWTYFGNTDPSTMMSHLVANRAGNGHGIIDGNFSTAAPDIQLGFNAGITIADALRSISGLDNMPEFEIAPIFSSGGTLAQLNSYHPRQGSDKTATVILHIGLSDAEDELLGFEMAPSMSGVVNAHTVIGDAPEGSIAESSVSGSLKQYPLHPASYAEHPASIAQYGTWETSEAASGASAPDVLQRAAKAAVAANVDPISTFKVTLDPDNSPAFGPQGAFWLGDTIRVEVTTPKKNAINLNGRVASASLVEAENGDVIVDLILEIEDSAAGVNTTATAVVVDSAEGTDPPPPPPPEPDPCAPVADAGGPDCPGAGSATKKKKKKKKR